MTSKVRVNMSICGQKTLIDADALEDGTVKVRIRSTCRDVRDFAKRLGPLGPEDYMEIRNSKILRSASDARLTPTCLVPTAVFNVVWMEVGIDLQEPSPQGGGHLHPLRGLDTNIRSR